MTLEHFERTVGVVSREVLFGEDGLSFVRGMMEGRHPHSPYADTMGFDIVEVEEGRVVFAGKPSERYLNPIGVVHGGWTATILDSAMAHATQTTLKVGEGHTTIEMKIGYVRPVMPSTGLVRCEAKLIHRGGRISTTEGWLTDENGRLLAHGTETCLIFPVDPSAHR
ncbi:PaaI family thioesterase [Paraburkholderia sp.]|uniref:PaaI family thioesterase n=1 Tax=Paraburkholderia sp. TaxID=1926495 RepID=UPI003D700179